MKKCSKCALIKDESELYFKSKVSTDCTHNVRGTTETIAPHMHASTARSTERHIELAHE